MTATKSRQGRTHNAEGAREAILTAAEKIFSEHGFDGARIDDIAAAAGYNKGLIFRYYGDKLRLYLEVIRRVDAATRGIQTKVVAALMEADALQSPERVAAMLKALIGEIFDYYLQNPRVMRIFQWEMAEDWQNYRQIAAQIDPADNEMLKPLMAQIQQAGLLRSAFDPLAQIVMATFQPMLVLGLLNISPIFFASGERSAPGGVERAREFAMEFVTGGLLADRSAANPGICNKGDMK